MKRLLLVLGVLALSGVAQGAETVTAQQKFMGLDNKVQALKQEALDLGKDIAILEEQLLFPANTQFVLYLSADVDESFKLVQAQVKVDERQIANYMYETGEIEALTNGAIQQLFKGNLGQGKHRLSVTYMGSIAKKPRRFTATYDFEKGKDTAMVEMQIKAKKLTEPGAAKDPQFAFVERK